LPLRRPPNLGRGDFFFSGSSTSGFDFGESKGGTLASSGFLSLDEGRGVDLVFDVVLVLSSPLFGLSADLDLVDFFFSAGLSLEEAGF